MGKDDPVALYIAAYDDPDSAKADYEALKALMKDGVIFLDVAALVARDDDGKLHVKENAHEVAGGTMIGAAAGLLVGLIFPPGIIAAGVVGGAVGAGIGKLVKMDRESKIEKDIEDVLPAGTSGIIAMFDITWKPKVDEALSNAAKIDKEDVSPESAQELKDAAAKA
jgi:arylsulfatase